MQTRTLLAGLAALTFVGAASADIVGVSSISSVGTAATLNGDPNVMVDGAGLSAALAADESNLATVTHGDAGAAERWVTTDPGGSGSDWFAASNGETVIFDITLDNTYTLDQFAAWGYGFGGVNGNSISAVTFDFSTDGGGTIDSSQSISVAEVFGTADIVALAAVDANFVRMTVTDNHFNGPPASHGGDRVGLVEIAFTGDVVPEPGSLALLGLGGLAMLRRRRG